MNSNKILYLSGAKKLDELKVTVETLICLFVYNYCELQLNICVLEREENYPISIPINSLQNIPYFLISHKDASILDVNCHFPAIHSTEENTFIAGICAVLRWAIKDHIELNPNHYCKELLGFRGGCLVACTESSTWTKFCEVQLPNSVQEVSFNTVNGHCLKIPENVLLLEEHLKRPVRTHNILKRKLNIVQKIKNNHAKNNISAEYDSTVNHLEQDMSCFTLYDSNSSVVNEVDLPDKLESMTITEKSEEFSLNHSYLEGIDFTLADMIVFPSIHYILKSLHPQAMTYLSNVISWYERMISKNVIQQAGEKCGLKKLPMGNVVVDKSISILVPEIDKNSLYKRDPTNNKMKIKHQNPTKLFPLLQEANIIPNYNFNYCSKLNWKELPEVLHPLSGDLPEKRISRKCQQIESVVTAVLKVAKPGQTIVEFCAGGGHVGLLLAYFLPSCKVILIENKESSMMRAKNRVKQLNFHNVTFYQCNLDYFKGSFHVGFSLHACGVATDLVLQQCIKNNASFVCCPCCYGGIQNTHLINYPLSKKFQSIGLLTKEYMLLAHCADRNEINTPTAEQGKLCMGLIDMDRIYYAEEHNYKTELTQLQPITCSPKHNLLIGISP